MRALGARQGRKSRHRFALTAINGTSLVLGAALLHMMFPPQTNKQPSQETHVAASYSSVDGQHRRTHGAGNGSGASFKAPSPEQIAEAQKILAQPVSPFEVKAKPYVDRVLSNPDLTQTIIDVSHINHSDPVSMIEVIAAETSAQTAQFGQNKTSSASGAMQITNDQFIRLLGTYGKQYAQNMRAYANATDRGDVIQSKADGLAFVAQFVRYQKDMIHFDVRTDLYDAAMKQMAPGAQVVPLQQRINALEADDLVSLGMQALSNEKDEQSIQSQLVSDTNLGLGTIFKRLGKNVFTRGSNYMGKGRFLKMCEMMLEGNGSKPVVGNLMDAKTAANNFSPEPDRLVMKKLKKGHRISTVAVRIPVTYKNELVAEKWNQQIKKWDGIYDGISADLRRRHATQTLAKNGQPQITPIV